MATQLWVYMEHSSGLTTHACRAPALRMIVEAGLSLSALIMVRKSRIQSQRGMLTSSTSLDMSLDGNRDNTVTLIKNPDQRAREKEIGGYSNLTL